jgi:cytochrome c oxidase subunit 1
VLAVSYVLPLVYLGWALYHGERAGNNPWGARGLEWQTTSPPPKSNFLAKPVVQTPYAYDKPEPEPWS